MGYPNPSGELVDVRERGDKGEPFDAPERALGRWRKGDNQVACGAFSGPLGIRKEEALEDLDPKLAASRPGIIIIIPPISVSV